MSLEYYNLINEALEEFYEWFDASNIYSIKSEDLIEEFTGEDCLETLENMGIYEVTMAQYYRPAESPRYDSYLFCVELNCNNEYFNSVPVIDCYGDDKLARSLTDFIADKLNIKKRHYNDIDEFSSEQLDIWR